ncbi:MAG TPA: DNA repair exonuclease [Acidobacteriota bacterium]|nr:DNA repair exonuclease [Acidobacteriota bacterium]
MVRILHTADLHLDTPFTGSGLGREKVLQRRNDMITVFRGITDLARRREVDLLLIAGDLFEDEYVNQATVDRVFAAIAELSPLPALISPGNHDPFHPASPYATEQLPSNLTVFRNDTVERIDFPQLDTSVHGLAFRAHHESRQLLKGLSLDAGPGINILLAHGGVFSGSPGHAEEYNPISREDLVNCGADYCALGHYHRADDVLSDKRGLRAAYPGSPEPLRYRHTGEHGVLLLEIEPDGGPISVERINTQRRRYHSFEIDLSDCADAAAVDARIGETIGGVSLDGDLVELVLSGAVPPGVVLSPSDYQDIAARVFDFRFTDRTRPDYDVETLATEPTARGAFCKEIMAEIESAEDPERKEILQRALWLGLAAFDGQRVEELPL